MDSLENPDFGLPDRGDLLIQMALELAGERTASIVAGEVERIRRPDGSIVSNDLGEYRGYKSGPLYALTIILSRDRITVSAWASNCFGFGQKRDAQRTVEQLFQREGITAAVVWVLASSKKKVYVDVLRDMLKNYVHSDHFDTSFRFLEKSLRKWR